VDSLGNASVIRAYMDGNSKDMDVTGWTYDLSGTTDADDFIFTFSRGLGYGSELNFTQNNGRTAQTLYADKFNYISFARYSPDGKRIAFVVRENPQDANANQMSEALISNIYILDVETGVLNQVTNFDNGYVETPLWSQDGNTLAFNVVVNGRINVFTADVGHVGVGSSDPVEIKPLETESTCCPAWMRK